MRFVAQHPGLVVGIRPERKQKTMEGEILVIRTGIQAEFKPNVWNQHDMEVALAAFQFQGLFQHEDEATQVSPVYRLAIYDTDEEYERRLDTEEAWTPEEKAFVEQRLMQSRALGEAFVVVPEETLAAPWPKYDDFDGTPDELVLTIHGVLGIPFETALEYERSKWGQQREDVIEALQTAINVRDQGIVVVE